MSRCSFGRRLVVSVVLLGVVVVLAGAPVQAQQNPPSAWLDAVAHTLVQWAPASWWGWVSQPGKRSEVQPRTPRVSSECGGCQQEPASSCYTGSIDPDGHCSS
jgi:hypothetical protein